MAIYSNFGVIGWVLTAAIGILVLAIIFVLIKMIIKWRTGPSHIEEYFEANFRNIINGWDLVTRTRVGEWKASMTDRLSALTGDITILEADQVKIDKRLFKLEGEWDRLERY